MPIEKNKYNAYSQFLHVIFLPNIKVNGPDMNKVLTQFNHFMQSKKYSEINQRVEHLEIENQRLLKDLKHNKNNAGRYQALKD